ncbi:MAG: hypothetical protein HFH85_14205 [Lachnospiraceae bacterium]|jgi:hypothetical protein|nr:hypothetical protein [Lachnospiraceae bacterium]
MGLRFLLIAVNLRADIAGMLEDMKSRFLRFPGGCLTHIVSLEERDRNAMYRNGAI